VCDRFRAYGYLFGYAEHAVDFFVKAGQEQENSPNAVSSIFLYTKKKVGISDMPCQKILSLYNKIPCFITKPAIS